jgi:hypothetical protein
MQQKQMDDVLRWKLSARKTAISAEQPGSFCPAINHGPKLAW